MAWVGWLAMVLMGGGGSPVELSCTVEGTSKGGFEARAVCERFAKGLSAAAGRSYALIAADTAPGALRDGVSVTIRFARGETVSATATIIEGGRARPVETRMISSSDRPLGLDSIGLLARDVARAMAKPD